MSNADGESATPSERGGTLGDAAPDAAYSIEETLEDIIRQHPLTAVGIALGLGFLISLTRRR